jgi:anti-sigma-K factor RskA
MSQVVLGEEIERLKKFDKNSKWVQSHYDKLEKEYKGEFVAIDVAVDNERPIDHDEDFERLVGRLKEKFGDLRTTVIQQVPEQRFGYII